MEDVIGGFVIKVIVGSVIAMVVLGVGIVGAIYILRPRVLLRRRLAQIGVLGGKESSEKAESRRQRRIQEKVKQLEQRGEKQDIADRINELLLQAGIDTTLTAFFIGCAVAGVFTALGYLMAGLPPLGAIGALLIGGLGLPRLFLGHMAKRRQKQFTQQFADAIDVVVRGIKSGLPVGECFNVIAREFNDPVASEFRMIVEGQKLGLTLEEMMRRALRRIPTAEYKFFAIVLQIQKQTGGNLADTLSNLSSVIRERKKMRDKVMALASEAKSSAMIIGSLPFAVSGLLALVNPDYLALLFTETAGNFMLAGGALWMGLGTFVMRQMINFEI